MFIITFIYYIYVVFYSDLSHGSSLCVLIKLIHKQVAAVPSITHFEHQSSLFINYH